MIQHNISIYKAKMSILLDVSDNIAKELGQYYYFQDGSLYKRQSLTKMLTRHEVFKLNLIATSKTMQDRFSAYFQK